MASDSATETSGPEVVLPEVKMHVVMPTAPVTATISGTRLCMKGKSASYIRHVDIDVSGTPLEGSFRAGQSFGVIPEGTDSFGKTHKVRLYSLASPTWGEDGHGRVITTTPKRVIAEREPQTPKDDPNNHSLFTGVCSNYLCDRSVGDKVQVSGPNGKRFLLPTKPDHHDYLFLATGTGIAPFRGFAMELLKGPPEGSPAKASWNRCTSQIHLVMGSPYTTDLLYDDLFRELAAKHPNFHYHTVISREQRQDGGRGEYVHQYIERRLDLFRPLLASPRSLIYVCGLAGMQVGLFQMLAKQGLGDGFLTVHEEIAAIPPAEWTNDQVKRRVRSTHRCMLEVY
jgi:ferredoxin--NADP+ reductase